jgi:hypothetical protein
MIANQNRIVSNIPDWNEKQRYSVNKVVKHLGNYWQNISGINTEPTEDGNWINVSPTSSVSFNRILQWDGSSAIIVSSGYSGTVYNQSNSLFCTYSVVGTSLTILSNASADDILQLTSN